MRHIGRFTLVLLLLTLGCGGGDTSTPTQEAHAVVDLEPDDPTILMRPFSAEEIREEWVQGFRLLMRRSYPEDTRIERWTVVSADDEGVEIETATILDDGSVEGEPSVSRSEWTELRDHASFPAAHSTREWVSRSTALGDFEGWLYRVADPGAAAVREFFFVPELPGAPVQMRALEGDTIVLELEQTARLRPDSN
jgi:hypothetical protein